FISWQYPKKYSLVSTHPNNKCLNLHRVQRDLQLLIIKRALLWLVHIANGRVLELHSVIDRFDVCFGGDVELASVYDFGIIEQIPQSNLNRLAQHGSFVLLIEMLQPKQQFAMFPLFKCKQMNIGWQFRR